MRERFKSVQNTWKSLDKKTFLRMALLASIHHCYLTVYIRGIGSQGLQHFHKNCADESSSFFSAQTKSLCKVEISDILKLRLYIISYRT